MNLRKIVELIAKSPKGDSEHPKFLDFPLEWIDALIDALVEQTAKADKAEWNHKLPEIKKLELASDHPRINWTDNDWRTQAKAELEIPDWRK